MALRALLLAANADASEAEVDPAFDLFGELGDVADVQAEAEPPAIAILQQGFDALPEQITRGLWAGENRSEKFMVVLREKKSTAAFKRKSLEAQNALSKVASGWDRLHGLRSGDRIVNSEEAKLRKESKLPTPTRISGLSQE